MKKSLNIAVLTVSDSRNHETDKSGRLLKESATQDGHNVLAHEVVKDEIDAIRDQVTDWINNEQIQVVLITGGTGFAPRDVTPEAVEPLFDCVIPGFGELFRAVSFHEIGTATIQSRAIAGLSNQTLIFAMPGSTGACHTAWNKILKEQLDSTFKPCNFVQILSY